MDRIRISTPERVVEELELLGDGERIRQEQDGKFPHSVILEGAYPEHDFATRWCWQNFGACDGECYEMGSEYPGCPIVLATGRVENAGGREKMTYSKVDAHVHGGSWTKDWLGKTDYNYGFCEYWFANESDRNQFVDAVPTFTWGENFDP